MSEVDVQSELQAMHALLVSADSTLLRSDTLLGSRVRDIAALTRECSVLAYAGKESKTITNEGSLWLYPVKTILPIFWVWKAIRMAKTQLAWQGTFRPHIVIATDTFGAGFAATRIAARFKKRLYVVCNEDTFTLTYRFNSVKNFFLSYLSRFVLERASIVEVPTAYIETMLLKAIPALTGRVKVIAPFIDIERMTNLASKNSGPLKFENAFFRILSPGPLIAPLRHDISIEVLERMSRSYTKMGLIFYGSGSEREHLLKLAQKKGLADKILFTPPETSPADLYNFAHVVLTPSDETEGGEEALIALAMSCPVVSSPLPLVEKAFGQLKYKHFICPRGDVNCFATRVKELMDSPGTREDYKINARDMIRGAFTRTRADYSQEVVTAWASAFRLEI